MYQERLKHIFKNYKQKLSKDQLWHPMSILLGLRYIYKIRDFVRRSNADISRDSTVKTLNKNDLGSSEQKQEIAFFNYG